MDKLRKGKERKNSKGKENHREGGKIRRVLKTKKNKNERKKKRERERRKLK